MLRFDDPLPRRPERVLIAGVSGVGKTSLARHVSDALSIPHTELDALFHGENWTPREDFLADARSLAARDAWITEWQYLSARPILASHADLLIWLDLPFFRVTLPRVILRTLRRRVNREVLWNGNTEQPFRTFFSDPEHIVRWAWATRDKYRREVPNLESEYPRLSVVRLRSQRQVDSWLAGTLARAAR